MANRFLIRKSPPAQIESSIGTTGGIQLAMDAAKTCVVGADALRIASGLLMHGPLNLAGIRDQLVRWMLENDCRTVDPFRERA